MAKRRVILLSENDLLGESLEHFLRGMDDVEMLGPWPADVDLLSRLSEEVFDLVVIAKDKGSEDRISRLMAMILQTHPDLPIIQVTPDRSEMLIFTSKILHATSADLIETIRRLPEITSIE